jgi:hypothetical protein
MSMKPGETTRFDASIARCLAIRRAGRFADAIADDADVGAEPRRAGAVDDAAVR